MSEIKRRLLLAIEHGDTYQKALCRDALEEIERLEREAEHLRASVPAVALPVYGRIS